MDIRQTASFPENNLRPDSRNNLHRIVVKQPNKFEHETPDFNFKLQNKLSNKLNQDSENL